MYYVNKFIVNLGRILSNIEFIALFATIFVAKFVTKFIVKFVTNFSELKANANL